MTRSPGVSRKRAALESRLEFVHRLSNRQIEQLWRLFQSEPWGRGRRLEDVRRAIEHSDLIFPLCDRETGRLVAFARVLTDYVYSAVILDLVIDRHDAHWSFGKLLADAIAAHPALLFVEYLDLPCHDEVVPGRLSLRTLKRGWWNWSGRPLTPKADRATKLICTPL